MLAAEVLSFFYPLASKSPPLGLTSCILHGLQGLILLIHVPLCDENENHSETTACNDSTASSLIVRLLVAEEEVWREPMGR